MNAHLEFHGPASDNPLSPAAAQAYLKTQDFLALRERVIKETESFLTRELRRMNNQPGPALRGPKEWRLALNGLASETVWASA